MPSFWSKTKNVPSAEQTIQVVEIGLLTIAIKPGGFAGFFATLATKGLVIWRMTQGGCALPPHILNSS